MVKRDGQTEPYMLFLRPDEMQAMAWLCNGALWSQAMMELDEKSKQETQPTPRQLITP